MKRSLSVFHFILMLGVLVIGPISPLWAGPAQAMEPLPGTDGATDPRGLALSDSIRAAAAGTAGVYLNPATMSMSRVYHVNTKYQFTGRDNLHHAGVALLDSITSTKLAAGAALDYRRDSKKGSSFHSWDARLAISAGFVNKFFLGITGRYLRVSHDLDSGISGPTGPPAIPWTTGPQANGFTLDTGIVARLGNRVTLGLVGYNLTNPGTVFAPLQLGSGLSVLLHRIWVIEGGTVVDFTSYDKTGVRLSLGTELLIQEAWFLRAGYSHEFHMRINQISAGVGYMGNRISVDLGYRQDIEFPSRFRLALGLTFFVG